MRMDILKRLYTRLAPWYDVEKSRLKDEAANESEHEVKLLAREAHRVIASYRRYGVVASQAKGTRNG